MIQDLNLLITSDRGAEEDARQEALSVLRELGDEGPLVQKTGIRGVLAAKTNLDPLKVIASLRQLVVEKPMSFLYLKRVIPVQRVIGTDLGEIRKVASEMASVIGERETFRITLEKRRTSLHSADIIKEAASDIERRVDLENPDKVVLIEVLGPITGISILRPNDVLSVDKELLSRGRP